MDCLWAASVCHMVCQWMSYALLMEFLWVDCGIAYRLHMDLIYIACGMSYVLPIAVMQVVYEFAMDLL